MKRKISINLRVEWLRISLLIKVRMVVASVASANTIETAKLHSEDIEKLSLCRMKPTWNK